jgi:hypothetical protein
MSRRPTKAEIDRVCAEALQIALAIAAVACYCRDDETPLVQRARAVIQSYARPTWRRAA